MYQPWHKRHSLPPYCSWHETSNILPDNKVNANNNDQCPKKEHFNTSGGQIWQMDRAVYRTTSTREWRQEPLRSKQSPSPWGIVQLAIQNEACARKTMSNTHFKQSSKREMDWGLCSERYRWGQKPSSRRRGSEEAGAGRYSDRWTLRIDI